MPDGLDALFVPPADPDAPEAFPDPAPVAPFEDCDAPAVDDPPPALDPFPEPWDELCPQPLETAATESATSAVDHPSRGDFIGRTYSERGVLAMCDGVRTWQGHLAGESFIWSEWTMRAQQQAARRARPGETAEDRRRRPDHDRTAIRVRRFRLT